MSLSKVLDTVDLMMALNEKSVDHQVITLFPKETLITP